MGRTPIWTDAERALVRDMWGAGRTAAEIAAAVGKDATQVRNLVPKIGARRPPWYVRSVKRRSDERAAIPPEAHDPSVRRLYRLLFGAVDSLDEMGAPREGPEADRLHRAIVEEAMRIARRSPGLCAARDSA